MSGSGIPALPGGMGERARQRAESLGRVQEEILRAQAEALGRTGERLESLLTRVADLDRLLDERAEPSAPALSDPATITAVRNRLRDEARQVQHGLIIQREAVGLVSHALVEQRYPIPPRRRSPEFDPARRRARHE